MEDKKPQRRIEKIVSIIVTHQNRIKCFINSLMKVKYGFANCSIIRLAFMRDGDAILYDVRLIFEGFGSSDKTYYKPVGKETGKNFIPFEVIHGMSDKFMGIMAKDIPRDIEFVFFLVRHGNSLHNQYTNLTKYKSLYNIDTLLTKDGEMEARKAGIFLQNYMETNQFPKHIHLLFSSDLKRTRQTLGIIMGQMKTSKPLDNVIIVLPCAHEISIEQENCDLKMVRDLRGILSGENKIGCSTDCDVMSEDLCCRVNTDLVIDWRYYRSFYGNQRRKAMYLSNNRYTCSQTNMIRNAMDIILDKLE